MPCVQLVSGSITALCLWLVGPATPPPNLRSGYGVGGTSRSILGRVMIRLTTAKASGWMTARSPGIAFGLKDSLSAAVQSDRSRAEERRMDWEQAFHLEHLVAFLILISRPHIAQRETTRYGGLADLIWEMK
ncbi:hypothetical protein B0H14DRAFT_2559611 [Mycena olivaceomarginata]|nr:hypothetical protein B0H14DRAFT_2559611 [Mycena olivaceomarginata]